MRKVLLSMAIVAGLMQAGPGLAKGSPFAPVVYVNNSAVTNYELDQRLRFMKLLGQPGGRKEALQALIEDRLRMDAAKRAGITLTPEQIDAGLNEFAGRAGMDQAQFTAALARGGVEKQAYRDFVSAGVAWREFVRQRFVGQVTVSDAEVERAMTKVIETPKIEQVLASELIIPAPPGQEGRANALAEQIRASVKNEVDFARAARQYSAAPTRGQGGRLQWMPVDNMPPALRQIMLSLKPGQMSPVLSVTGAVVLFYMRDQKGGLRPGAKDQVLDIAQVVLGDANAAAQVAGRVDSCDDLYATVAKYGGGEVVRETLPQSRIPSDIALRLASMDPNETAVMSRGGAGVTLVMLCKRTPALLVDVGKEKSPVVAGEGDTAADPNALPDRKATQDAIFNAKIQALAEAYLKELQADAVIRTP